MKKAILGFLLSAALTCNGAISQFQASEKRLEFDKVVAEHTLERTPAGELSVDFTTFRKIGLDYATVGTLAEDLADSKHTITAQDTKKYVITDGRKTNLLYTIEEIVDTNRIDAKYLVKMVNDGITIGANFHLWRNGSNTAYSVEAYVQPDTLGKRMILRAWAFLYSPFEKDVDKSITNLAETSGKLFQEIRENPKRLDTTRLKEENKRYIKSLFENKEE